MTTMGGHERLTSVEVLLALMLDLDRPAAGKPRPGSPIDIQLTRNHIP